jgi:hypothetical protein
MAGMDAIQHICDEVLARASGSRVTLRLTAALAVRYESLAPGIPSIFDGAGIDLGDQPVPKEVKKGNQVVQHECAACFTDMPHFHSMLAAYGVPGTPMSAQIVTPVQKGGEVVGALSLHIVGGTRGWDAGEPELCRDACARIAELLP